MQEVQNRIRKKPQQVQSICHPVVAISVIEDITGTPWNKGYLMSEGVLIAVFQSITDLITGGTLVLDNFNTLYINL